MDDKGRLVLTDKNGNETFRGRTFEENGLVKRSMNPHKRRAAAAQERKLMQLLHTPAKLDNE